MNRNLYLLLSGNILSHIGSGTTMLAVPWLMAKQPDGEKIYGYTIVAIALFSIFVLPGIGSVIDYFSRKKVIIGAAIFGFSTTLTIALVTHQAPTSPVIWLIILYATGTLVYNIHFPALFSLIQEIFPVEHYKRINGLMEVQGQIAMMSAGGLGGILIDKVPLSWILLLDAASYLISIVLFLFISYHRKALPSRQKKALSTSIFAGFIYLRTHPRQGLFFLGTMVPFIMVMVNNYLFPIHLSKTLGTSATAFGIGEILWAGGAIIAGITVPIWLRFSKTTSVILRSFVVFIISMTALASSSQVSMFFVVCLLMGWSNASIRVARNTAMMEIIDNAEMGRVNTAFMTIGSLLKISLVFTLANALSFISTFIAFFILTIVLALAFILVFTLRKSC